MSQTQSTNYIIRYKDEEYRVTVWHEGSTWTDWDVIHHDDPDKEISLNLTEEIMEALNQYLAA